MAASKDARSAAAKKRASVKAQERTRRTVSTPGKTTEGGAGNIPASVARAAMTIARHLNKSKSSKPKSSSSSSSKSKTMSANEYQKEMSATRAANKSYRDKQIRDQRRADDERSAKAAKSQKAADAVKRKAMQQGVTRASGGSKPKGSRKYN